MDAAAREDVKKRLRRIEGQVRGVLRMVEEGRSCQELLQQLVAIRSAVQQASVVVARSYAGECLAAAPKSARSQEALIDDLINTLARTN